jgi:predicted metal-dependent phosphoesterase TrpH
VRAAAAVGLAALAITDHDTLSAISVAEAEANRVGVELVPGIELTAEHEARELHILGHFIDAQHANLREVVSELKAARTSRIQTMAARLEALGLSVDVAALTRMFPRATLGRRHLAEWLVKTGQVPTSRQAFGLYLGDRGPVQTPKLRVAYRRAIELIRNAGGVAGLAHPPYDFPLRSFRDLVDCGLGAIEVGGPGAHAKLSRRYRAWADEVGLVPIAGSDFHAADRPGRWVGAVVTPGEDLARLRAKATRTPAASDANGKIG